MAKAFNFHKVNNKKILKKVIKKSQTNLNYDIILLLLSFFAPMSYK